MTSNIQHRMPSGRTLNLAVLDHSSPWHAVPGIYLFCRLDAGRHVPVYIGQCDSFRDRIPCHERADEAKRLGAYTVLAAVVPNALERDHIERELIREFSPQLNTQHMPTLRDIARGGLFGAR